MSYWIKRAQLLLALFALLVVTACGGGDGFLPVTEPTITAQPADTQVTAGSAVRFSVTADGADVTFQWQRSTDSGTTWVAIAGATSASYSLAAPTVADSGSRFRVLLSRGGLQTISSTVTLTVSALAIAPAITVQPQPAQVIAGGSASFAVTATGTTLAYRWQTSSDGSTWADAAAGTTATLTLPAVALSSNQLQVRVIVANSLASITSNPVRLTVLEQPVAPTFTQQPTAATVVAPGTATFTVVASGTPAPTLQWQRSTDGGATYSNIAGATASSYTTAATSLADSGTRYRVVASNATASVNSNAAVLTVTPALVAPAVTSEPVDATVAAGASVTFSATANGNPQPVLQWQISTDGGLSFANINGATAVSYTVSVAASDNGRRYRVVATNSQGSITSRAALLTVTAIAVLPTFTSEPADVSVAAGAQVSFSASVSGNPAPTLQWQSSTDGGVTFTNISGATAASYGGLALSNDNGSRYRVVATNSQGAVTSRAASLTVTAAPTASVFAGRAWTAGQQVATGSLIRGGTATAAAIDGQGRVVVLFGRLLGGRLALHAMRGEPGPAGGQSVFGAPVVIDSADSQFVDNVTLAVSPGGNAIAGWVKRAACGPSTYNTNPNATCNYYYNARYMLATGQWEAPRLINDMYLPMFVPSINDAGDVAALLSETPAPGELVPRLAVGWRVNGQADYTRRVWVNANELFIPYSVTLDSAGRTVVAGATLTAPRTYDITTYRGNVRSGLGAAETVDVRGASATFLALYTNASGQSVLLWSQDNGVRPSVYGATVDTAGASWALTDTGQTPPSGSAVVAAALADDGEFIWYSYSSCTAQRRSAGTWFNVNPLPATLCQFGGVPGTPTLARNGNLLTLNPTDGSWSAYDARRDQVFNPLPHAASGAGYLLGFPKPMAALPGTLLLSDNGVGAYVSVNTFSVLPTAALPNGDSGPASLWAWYFK